MRLATGFRPDPLGELTALPRPTAELWEGERNGREGRVEREGKRERGGATAPQNGSLYSPWHRVVPPGQV